MIRRRAYVIAGCIVAIMAVLPLITGDDTYTMRLLLISMVWGGLALSWDLQLGYAGVFNLGQVGFFVCGAYASGMLTIYAGVSPWLGMVAGAAVGGLIAVALGMACLRLTGIYIALLTLAFFEVLGPLLTVGRPWGTGGKSGLLPIPPLSWGGQPFSVYDPLQWYYVALGLLIVSMIVVVVVVRSRIGRGFIALRDSESLAQALGVDRFRSSLAVVGISGALAGLLGAFYASYQGVLSPRLLGLDLFLFLIIAIIAGGVGKFPGAVIGAIAVTFVTDSLRPTGTYRLLILGVLVVVLVMFLPAGAMGGLDSATARIKRWRTRRARPPVVDVDLKEP